MRKKISIPMFVKLKSKNKEEVYSRWDEAVENAELRERVHPKTLKKLDAYYLLSKSA